MDSAANGNLFPLLLLLIPFVIWLVVRIFQWLWNTTMPEIFKLPELRFWQALRLLIIAAFLFGQRAADS